MQASALSWGAVSYTHLDVYKRQVRKSSVITLVVSTGVPEVVATPEPVEPTVNEDGSITVQESWWPSADGSHQIHQLTDGTMWNENGQRCDAQGNPIA